MNSKRVENSWVASTLERKNGGGPLGAGGREECTPLVMTEVIASVTGTGSAEDTALRPLGRASSFIIPFPLPADPPPPAAALFDSLDSSSKPTAACKSEIRKRGQSNGKGEESDILQRWLVVACEWWRLKAAGRKCGKKRGGAGGADGAFGAVGASRLAVEKGPVLADTLMPSGASCPLRT